MNVTFLTARYPPDVLGGGEISTQLVAEALAAAGHAVTVLCGAPRDAAEQAGGVRIRRRRALQAWWRKPLQEHPVSARTARVVERLLAAGPTSDILHAQEFRSALALSLIEHPRRFVTIRDYAPICGTTNNLWWDGTACNGCFWTNVLFRCHRVTEAALPRKPFRVWQYKGNLGFRLRAFRALPHHVYTSSALEARVLGRLQPPPTVTTVVIPNPVDQVWLDFPPTPPPTAPIVYGFGRLEHTKGIDVLLRACAGLRFDLPTLQLHLGGGEADRYRRLAAVLGLRAHVTFHGFTAYERVRELIDQSAVVVSAHRWEEPFGRAALEAGARARPLITSDLGGVRETTSTETAVRVPPGDHARLAAALRDLLTHPERVQQMGSAARRHVEAHYRPPAIAERLRAAYARAT